MNKEQLVDHLLDVYVQLRVSGIEGIGCFAVRSIPRAVNPFRNPSSAPAIEYVKIERSQIPSSVNLKILQLLERYCYTNDDWIEVPSWGLNTVSLENYLNHSTKPNLRLVDGHFLTLRRIGAGEELTFDYNSAYDCKHEYK